MVSVLHFNGTWRSYQERILNNLNYHLRDSKLHVVAAPGAGKTTLGIEVISRIGRPSLILCPTNTIKHQWRERICSSFLQPEQYDLVTTDIRSPRYITVITYQALLAAFCGTADDEEQTSPSEEFDEQEEKDDDSISASARFRKDKADEVIRTLTAAGVSLLCFDEAHHLRKEWWKALTYLNEHLRPAQTLALTATPPYDADQSEWKRYQELCGDIDEVISIPELVKNGDLCPHQDFIYFSYLREEERALVQRHAENVRGLIETLKADADLLRFLAAMRFFRVTEPDVERIFETPDFYVSIASLLCAAGYTMPPRFLDLFDAKQGQWPAFDEKRAAIFLNGFLYPQHEEDFAGAEAKRTEYMNHARHLGLVVNKKIVLDASKKVQRQIASSLGKLDSIVDIVRMESSQLGQYLRMVILTDFIRIDDVACTSLGVVPVWKTLKDAFGTSLSMGVLCGSLILLPDGVVGTLQELLAANNIPADAITLSRFKDIDQFVRVTPREGVRNHIVRLITDMFNSGWLTVLIGTQALLGEGWDAPSINSLILSSTVSSYMLSNQMRGRAIRIDRNNPYKVSNIWHLATVDTPSLMERNPLRNVSTDEEALNRLYTYDLEQLTTRFKGYEAPSYYGAHDIRSGIERIMDQPTADGGTQEESLRKKVERVKAMTMQLAADRNTTGQWWQTALYDGYGNADMRLATGVNTEQTTMRQLMYKGYKFTYYALLSAFVTALCLYLFFPLAITKLILAVTVIVSAFIAVKTTAKYLRTGSVTKVMRQIAIIILESMSRQGLIRTSAKLVGLNVREDKEGALFVSCANLPAEENNLFIQALQEFLDPIDNPRYLLVRRAKGMLHQTDYFAVPAAISQNKNNVGIFEQLWRERLGDGQVVYTRNQEGRRLLLKARKNAFSASKRKKSQRLSKWQ